MRPASLLPVLLSPACALVTVPFTTEPPSVESIEIPEVDWSGAVDQPSDGSSPNYDRYREVSVTGELAGTLPAVGFVQLENVQGSLSEASANDQSWTNATLRGRIGPERLVTVTVTFFVDPETGVSTYTSDNAFACVGPDRFSIDTCDYPRAAEARFLDDGGDTLHLELFLTFDEDTTLFAGFDLPAPADDQP
ncbi:MAG: hypothetical protein AAF602_16505 [Myxococcota bacterium]